MQKSATNTPVKIKRESQNTRQQNRERRLLKRLLGFAVAMILLAPLLSPHFRVRKVEVKVAQDALLPQEEARYRETLTLPKRMNWVLAPVARIRRSLEHLPFIETAKVTQEFPNHIVAELHLREPFAILSIGANKYEIDKKGYPIRVARNEVIGRLPGVEFEEDLPLKLGEQVTARELPLWLSLLAHSYARNTVAIQKIRVDRTGNLCLNMKDGLEVQLGQAEELEEKTALLNTVYERDPTFGSLMVALNVSVPQSPSCRRRVAPGAASPAVVEPPLPKQGETLPRNL